MKLSINERLTIVQIIPEKGNFKTMKIVENLNKALYLSEEELKEFEVTQNGDQLKWNKKGTGRHEVGISEFGMEIIMESFEALDKDEKLSIQYYQVFKYLKEELETSENKK